jgi:hypothetical protein
MSRPIYNNFTSGEISPRAEGRIDLEAYFKSAREITNFIPTKQGGVDRRPGTVFVAYAKEDDEDCRLIPFQLAAGNYVLEVGGGSAAYTRFFKDRAQITSGGSPVEVADGWLADDVDEVQFAQTNTTLYFTHEDYNVHQLTRTSDTVWTMGDVTFTGSGAPTFNTESNRPGCITFFEQRMVLGGSINNPNRIWLSKTGDPVAFGSADNLIFDIYHTLPISLRWLTSKAAIVFGSDNAEGVVSGNGLPLTTTNYQIQVQTSYGCSRVQGLVANDKVLYVPKNGKMVHDFGYLQDIDGWYAEDLNVFADHILPSVKCWALQRNPETILWIVTDDGELVGCTYDRRINMVAWFRCEIDGDVKSIAVIPSTYAVGEDEVWIAVARDVDGTTKMCIEYFMPRDFRDDQHNAYFVDSGAVIENTQYTIEKIYAGEDRIYLQTTEELSDLDGVTVCIHGITNDDATVLNEYQFEITTYGSYLIAITDEDGNFVDPNTISDDVYDNGNAVGYVAVCFNTVTAGIGHLEGEEVSILADGAVHPTRTVKNGYIALTDYVRQANVGRAYRSTLKLQRPEIGMQTGTSQGLIRRVIDVFVRFYKSLGCKVGPDENTLDAMIFRTTEDPLGSPPPLFTGDKKLTFPGSWDDQGDIVIVQDDPLPLNIVAVIPEVEVSDE